MEAILSGDTEVEAAHLHRYVDELLTPGPAGRTRLDKQFKVSSCNSCLCCDQNEYLNRCSVLCAAGLSHRSEAVRLLYSSAGLQPQQEQKFLCDSWWVHRLQRSRNTALCEPVGPISHQISCLCSGEVTSASVCAGRGNVRLHQCILHHSKNKSTLNKVGDIKEQSWPSWSLHHAATVQTCCSYGTCLCAHPRQTKVILKSCRVVLVCKA